MGQVKELVWVVENETHADVGDIKTNTPNCIVDPADRFTYLNGAATMPASGNSIFDTNLTYPSVGTDTKYPAHLGSDLADSLMRHWDQVESAVLQLNGHDRFSRRHGKYFKYKLRYHNSRIVS